MGTSLVPGPPGVTGPMMVFEPAEDPRWYKTYEIQQELYEVPCEQAGCRDYLLGFVTVIDTSTDLGRAQAAWIRRDKSRSHPEEPVGPDLVKFMYPPGTKCFAPTDGTPRHTKPRDGEQTLIERGGDWRGNPSGLYIEHTRAEHFIESWADNQAALAELAQRG